MQIAPAPYAGITGFINARQVEDVLDGFPEMHGRQLMVGVLASMNTLRNRRPRKPMIMPTTEALASPFLCDSRVLNLIHYYSSVPLNPEHLTRLTRLGGPNLHGFQLNLTWPNPGLLAEWRERVPEQRIVLQIGRDAVRSVSNDHDALIERLRPYRGSITDVLFDLSGGRGRPLNVGSAIQVLTRIGIEFPEWGLGAAGGLAPHTLNQVRPLLSAVPRSSLDVQSGVIGPHRAFDRPASGSACSNDSPTDDVWPSEGLNRTACLRYVDAAAQLIGSAVTCR